MAATETTNDAVIIIPPGDEGKVQIQSTESRTTVTATSPVQNLSFEVLDGGNLKSEGSKVKSSTFSFTGAGTVEISNEIVNDINVFGDADDNRVDMGSDGGKLRDSKVKASEGSDTVTAAGKVIKNVKIDLGVDNDVDNVTLDAKLKDVNNMVIKNFGKEDTFTYKGTTYDYKQLKDQPFSPEITFKFS